MTVVLDPVKRLGITVSVMLATIMTALDTTIAIVALPHIQGSVQASPEQIGWVLTSYIIAGAIMTPLSGWIADKIGRKRLYMVSIIGFILASMLCGIATSLPEIVAFRLLQGLFGAALVPVSQAMMLDINPPEKHGQAMAIWGMGTMLGPILGPVIGGWLTDHMSWRWVFYINLPVGIVALIGVWMFISGDKGGKTKPFDFLGFGALVVFIGGVQLLLDRGPSLDWFDSPEIWIELILSLLGLWVFIIHSMTAKHPFFDLSLARDGNFVTGSVLGFFLGVMLFGAISLLPAMMQNLMGYPVLTSGIVSMPRGIGTFFSMMLVGQLIGRMDLRLIPLVGLSLTATSFWMMSHFDLTMTSTPIMVAGFVQGLGTGLAFIPLTTLAFATVSPRLRNEGAALNTLVRNLGSSIGISIVGALAVHNASAMHESMAAHINPDDPVVQAGIGATLAAPGGLEMLNAEISRQAMMVAYVDDFKLMFILTLVSLPLLLFLRTPKGPPGGSAHAAVE